MPIGAQSVMTSGTTEMPVWCADNWDTPHMVCCGEYIWYIYIYICQGLIIYSIATSPNYTRKADGLGLILHQLDNLILGVEGVHH